MTRGAARLRVGALLIATALGLVALLLMARWPTLWSRGAEHVAWFADASGLDAGDDVRIGGVAVGTVAGVQLDPGGSLRVRVRFRLRDDVRLDGGVRARVTQAGLLGEPYLELRRVAPPAPLVAGAPIPSEDTPSLADALARGDRILRRADSVLAVVERAAAGDPLARVDSTLRRVDALLARADDGAGRAFATADRVGARVDALLERTDRLLVTVDTTVRAAGPGITTLQADAAAALRDLRGLLGEVRDALGDPGEVSALVENLSAAAENAARLTERLERDPTSVLSRRRALPKPRGPNP